MYDKYYCSKLQVQQLFPPPPFSLFYLKYIVIIKTNEIKYKPTYNKKEKSNASNNWARFQCDESFCKDTTGSYIAVNDGQDPKAICTHDKLMKFPV